MFPKDKNKYNKVSNLKEPDVKFNKGDFERDGDRAYTLQSKDYYAVILTNESESHYYWYVTDTEGSMLNINKLMQGEVERSFIDFKTFGECIDHLNKYTKDEDDFFANSRYNWKLKRNGSEAGIYMQSKRGKLFWVEVSKDFKGDGWTYYGPWDVKYNKREVGGKTGQIVHELEEKNLGDWYCPKVENVEQLDNLIDDMVRYAGMTVTNRF